MRATMWLSTASAVNPPRAQRITGRVYPGSRGYRRGRHHDRRRYPVFRGYPGRRRGHHHDPHRNRVHLESPERVAAAEEAAAQAVLEAAEALVEEQGREPRERARGPRERARGQPGQVPEPAAVPTGAELPHFGRG